MKKKVLIIILVVFLIALVVLVAVKGNLNKNNKSKNETSRNFIMNETTNSTINTHGENSGIYVGVTDNGNDNYLFISIKIDKTASKEEQAKALISEISKSIGYKIDINSLEIDGSKIKVDFAKTSAPFELQESVLNSEDQKYFISSDNVVPKTIFDSINKTFKSYFGANTEVYFSSDSENINIENNILSISIDKNVAY